MISAKVLKSVPVFLLVAQSFGVLPQKSNTILEGRQNMISISLPSSPNIYVQILQGVVIKEINTEFLTLCAIFSKVAAKYGKTPVLTGAGEARSPIEPLHAAGYAWDWRSRDFAKPLEILGELLMLADKCDTRYTIIYDTGGTGPHFHSEFRIGQSSAP